MSRVERAAVFFFDILGFTDLVDADLEGAVDALSDLATMLNLPEITGLIARWEHRYALSDSVFLTRTDCTDAAKAAADLMFNLVGFTLSQGRPTLIRGGLAFGEIEHVRAIFRLESDEPGNLIGPAVAQAVHLERAGRGPRIFVSAPLATELGARAPALAAWLVEKGPAGVHELLWMLPPDGPEAFDEAGVADIWTRSLELLAQHGAHPEYGEHYREFVLLAARCLRRARIAERAGRLDVGRSLAAMLAQPAIEAACRNAGALPPDFLGRLLTLVEPV
jgi:hypothetical protein